MDGILFRVVEISEKIFANIYSLLEREHSVFGTQNKEKQKSGTKQQQPQRRPQISSSHRLIATDRPNRPSERARGLFFMKFSYFR